MPGILLGTFQGWSCLPLTKPLCGFITTTFYRNWSLKELNNWSKGTQVWAMEPCFELSNGIPEPLFLSTEFSWFRKDGDEPAVSTIPPTIHSTNICEAPTKYLTGDRAVSMVPALRELSFQHIIFSVYRTSNWRYPESENWEQDRVWAGDTALEM